MPFSLEEILGLRQSEKFADIYIEFMPKVVGKTAWTVQANESVLSKWCNITTEALMILILENNWNMWKATANNKITEKQGGQIEAVPSPKYTSNQFGGRNPGWTMAGQKRYIELVSLIHKDRETVEGKLAENQLLQKVQGRRGTAKIHQHRKCDAEELDFMAVTILEV